MPLGNPIRKQNESRIVSVLATEGQTVFTVQGGYIINNISVFRNGVRLSNSEDFTAGDGSTVTLNNAANVDDRIEFHIFDRFTVQNAIIGAASTQTINGDLVLNGKLFGELDVPSINTGIGTFGGDVSIAENIIHTGDTNTKMSFPAADTINFSTGGSERVRITSGGLVGVGQGTPTHMLHVDSSNASDSTATAFFKGRIVRVDGSASANSPRLNFSLDGTDKAQILLHRTNVGLDIATLAAEPIKFETNSDEKMRITSAGLVGIGTVNPARILHLHESSSNTVQLHITNSTTGVTGSDGVSFALGSDESLIINQRESNKILLKTADTDRMTVDANGRVLINDSSARAHDGGNNPQFQVSSNASGNWARISSTSYINSDIGGGIILSHSRNGTIGSHTVVQNGDKLGSIFFEGSDGTDFARGARIESRVDGTPGDNDMPGRLEFYTTSDGASTETERLRIKSNGSVNIGLNPAQSTGTNTTNAILTVKGYPTSESSAAILALVRGSNTASIANNHTLGRIVFADKQAGEYAFIEGEAEAGASVGDTPGRLVFSTAANNTSAPTERMRIKEDGEILIGTTTDRPIAAQKFNSGAGWSGTLQIEKANPNTNNNNVPIVAITAFNGSNESYTGGISFNRSNSNTQGTQGAVNTNQQLGNIAFNGSDGTNFIQGAEIFAIPDQTFATNDGPTSLVFGTTADGTSNDEPQERMRITSGGDVLIADTSNSIYNDSSGGGMNLKANGQLVLKKEATSTADPLVWLNDTGQTTNKFIVFAQDGTERANIGLADKTVTITSTANNSIATQIVNQGTSGGHGLKIRSGGTGTGSHLLNIESHVTATEKTRLLLDASGALRIGEDDVSGTTYRTKISSESGQTYSLILGERGGQGMLIACRLDGAGSSTSAIRFADGPGVSSTATIAVTNTTVTYNTGSSDRTMKKNFENWTETVLTKFKNLNPQKFNYKVEEDGTEKTKGYIAQDLVEDFPEAYPKDPETDKYSFNPSGMVVYLMKALQEATTKIETLETKVAALEAS